MFSFFENRVDITAPPTTGSPPVGLIAFYRHFLGEYKRLFVTLFTVGLGLAMADAMVPVFIGQLVTLVGASNREAALAEAWPSLFWMLVVMAVFRPLLLLLDLLLRNSTLTPGVTSRLRWLSHWHVVRQSWRFFQNDHAGRLANRVMQTAGALRESAEAAVRAVWYIAMYGGTSLVLMGTADLWLALPTAAWFLGYGLCLWYFVPRLRGFASANAEAHSNLVGRIVDSYSNILTVKLFARANQEDGYVGEAVMAHNMAQQMHMRVITRFMFSLALLNTALLVGTAGAGLYLWVNGGIDAGTVAMALPLAWQITSMAGWVAWEVTGIFENVATVQEGMQTIAAQNTLLDAPDAKALKVTTGAIEFERVTFGYEGQAPIFKEFELSIRPGERVGLVGLSGAGKSTLASLLLRLFDTDSGRILIDGQAIKEVTQDSLRAAIGVVTQDTSLLHRSVGDNILYGRPDAEPEQLLSATRQARANEFIDNLKDQNHKQGYEATVGERGVKLSGGQRQRIAIARVLLKNAPILILDEATSALDSEAEQAIQEQLTGLMVGKTVITIAHRLSTLIQMDRLLVLDGGKIIEQGSHAELIAKNGLYASLWKYQSGNLLPTGNTLFGTRPRIGEMDDAE